MDERIYDELTAAVLGYERAATGLLDEARRFVAGD